MKAEDGGGIFSLIMDKLLIGNGAFTVVFKGNSIFDITTYMVINAQQAIKKTHCNVTSYKSFSLGYEKHMKMVPTIV